MQSFWFQIISCQVVFVYIFGTRALAWTIVIVPFLATIFAFPTVWKGRVIKKSSRFLNNFVHRTWYPLAEHPNNTLEMVINIEVEYFKLTMTPKNRGSLSMTPAVAECVFQVAHCYISQAKSFFTRI